MSLDEVIYCTSVEQIKEIMRIGGDIGLDPEYMMRNAKGHVGMRIVGGAAKCAWAPVDFYMGRSSTIMSYEQFFEIYPKFLLYGLIGE
jgi:hypothetical protein